MNSKRLTDLFAHRFEIDIQAKQDSAEPTVGTLRDRVSGEIYRIVGGIPRFVDTHSYADAFGLQWNAFRGTQLDSRSGRRLSFQRFFENTRWLPRELHGATVLEAGSGAGRFTEVLLDAGAQVATFDLSSAIDANYANNSGRGECTFFQASIYDIPCKPSSFDFVFCYGVLQHTPDPDKAFRSLIQMLRPGGRISVDYYLKTSRLDPFNQPKYFWRKRALEMDPERLLKFIRSYMPYWLPIDTAIRRIPFLGPKMLAFLRVPCWNYLRIGLTREQRLEWAILDTFDALSAYYDYPKTLEEAAELANSISGLTDIEVFYGSNGVVVNATRKGTACV